MNHGAGQLHWHALFFLPFGFFERGTQEFGDSLD